MIALMIRAIRHGLELELEQEQELELDLELELELELDSISNKLSHSNHYIIILFSYVIIV